MKQVIWATVGAAALSLAACYPASETPSDSPGAVEAPESDSASAGVDPDLAPFTDLLGATYTQSGAVEADLTGLLEALPTYAGVDWETMRFDSDTGATVFTGLDISLGTDAPVGMRFEEASVWGLDADFLAARLRGERLDESGPVMTRFDGRQFSYFGFGDALNFAMNGFFDLIAEGEELPEDFNFSVDAFDYSGARFLMTDVSLLPWEFSPLSADILPDELDEEPEVKALLIEGIHLAQHVVAGTRSLAMDKAIMTDISMAMTMRQPSANVDITSEVELYTLSGMRGFDYDQTLVRNAKSIQTTEYVTMDLGDDTFGEVSPMGLPAGMDVTQETTYAMAKSADIRLNKVLGFLARGEIPNMDERDLLSLGRGSATDFAFKLNGADTFAVREIRLDVDQFEWLIPSDLAISFDGGVIHISELTSFAKGMMEGFAETAEESMSPSEASELAMVLEGMDKGLELLPDYGLDKLTLNGAFTAKWNADQGPADFAYTLEGDGFGSGQLDLGLTFPVYETLRAASQSEDPERALETAFEDAFAIRSGSYFERDLGGYDKILGFVNAIGAEYPDQGWGAMVSNMEPAQMRAYGATLVRMGRASAEQEFPPAAEWLDAIAAYVETGGSIEFAMRPTAPVTAETFDELDETDDPQAVVARLGLSVTHTPN
ncbi:MAG: hypothetical protein QNI84_00845 [Henriciella sp.]|nr:hypothetical protein [Henriciella sp.]